MIPVTYILIGLIVAVSFYAFSNETVMARFIHNAYMVSHRGQYYRFLTSGFIHKDHMHLLWNMFSFFFFGRAVEEIFKIIFGDVIGIISYLGLFLLGIVVSDIPAYFKNRDNPGYNSLGASGGVSSVIFAFILFQPLQDICLYFALCIPGFIMGTLYVIFSWYQGRRSNDNINHDAHLYGALFGLIFCGVMVPESIPLFFEQIKNWKIFN